LGIEKSNITTTCCIQECTSEAALNVQGQIVDHTNDALLRNEAREFIERAWKQAELASALVCHDSMSTIAETGSTVIDLVCEQRLIAPSDESTSAGN
jgi:hypothetical protein